MKFSLFKGRLGQNGGRMLESQAHCFLKSNYYIFFTEMSHIDDILGVLVRLCCSGDLSTAEM